MSDILNCPKCDSEYTYNDGTNNVCSMCGHEWNELSVSDDALVVFDANGNKLADGDSVVIIKDLKVKGASNPIKQGTMIKGIGLFERADGHNISCKVPGFGSMYLKSEFVKKA